MKKKVLVVDDERGIVKLLSMRLRAKGYEVFEAYDGSECINIAIKELPQLILLDINMPLNGIDAFQEMLKIDKTRNIPVIFMTAYHTPDINTQVLEMGAKACMSKPFFGNEIINNIAMYI